MTADPEGFADRSRHLRNLLDGLEPDFLSTLAEHQKQQADPKAGGGEAAVSPLSLAGTSTGGEADVEVIVRADEESFVRYFSALTHYTDHACVEGEVLLLTLAQFVIEALATAGSRAGWFKVEEEDD